MEEFVKVNPFKKKEDTEKKFVENPIGRNRITLEFKNFPYFDKERAILF